MSSHRKECVPKHRAQRQPEVSDRSARFHHAMKAVKAVLVRSRPGGTQVDQGGDVVECTGRPGKRTPLPRGWLSSALVNPWFAAGTGLVIAAGLALYAPHKVVSFMPDETNPALCESRTCGSGVKSSGSLATSTPGIPIKANEHAHSRPLDSGAVRVGHSRIWVHLAVTRQDDGKFVALVTLRSRRKLRSWRLSFSLPGAKIEMVLGARWQAKGQHGGIASALLHGGNGQENWPGSGHWRERRNGRVVQFWIVGTGSAAGPAGCVLDGHSCHFSS